MISLAFLLILVVVAFLAFTPRRGPLVPPATFVRWSWVPLAALAIQLALGALLVDRLAYLVLVLPFMTLLASFALGFIGIDLLRRGGGDVPRGRLAGATVLASLPWLLLVGYLAWSVARSPLN